MLLYSAELVSSTIYMDKAKAFIEFLYKDIKRKTGEPYTSHLYGVYEILKNVGVDDEDVLVIALLHDVLEDTDITGEYLKFKFGAKVATVVETLSKNRDWNTSFCSMQGSMDNLEQAFTDYPEALMIKMADRLHNLRTIEGFSMEKKKEYLKETQECLMPVFERSIVGLRIGQMKKHIERLIDLLKLEIENVKNVYNL